MKETRSATHNGAGQAKRNMFVGADVNKESIDISLAGEGALAKAAPGPVARIRLTARPRVRANGREVRLPTFQAMANGDPLKRRGAPAGTYCIRLYGESPYGSSSPSNEVRAVVASAKAWLWGVGVDGSGVCIEGVTVEVVAGQRLGERIMQETPCQRLEHSGGFVFRDLTPGVEKIIRASGPGDAPLVRSVMPYLGP